VVGSDVHGPVTGMGKRGQDVVGSFDRAERRVSVGKASEGSIGVNCYGFIGQGRQAQVSPKVRWRVSSRAFPSRV